MKHLRHLLGTDLRHFRLLLAIWVAMQIVDTVLRGVRPTLAPEFGHAARLGIAIDLLAQVLFLVRWLGFLVIVPLVVHAHPLVGSEAFWLTRPIAWRALLASKVTLLFVTFVAVPAACEFLLMLVSRVPAGEAGVVVLQTILLQSQWLLGIMAFAAMTRNLARFALAVGGVLVAFVLFISVSFAVLVRTLPDGPRMSLVTVRTTDGAASGIVALVLLCLAAVAVLVVQYRTRSTRLAVAAGLTGVLASVLVGYLWPSQPRPLPAPDWANRESALTLTADSQEAEFKSFEEYSPWGRSSRWRMGRVRAKLSGVESGWLATVRLAESSIQFPDGRRLDTAGNGYQSTVPLLSNDDRPLRVVMRQVLGVDRVFEPAHDRPPGAEDATPGIVVAQDAFKTYSGMTGTYRARFVVDVDEVRIVGVLPLEAGAEFHERGYRMVIDRVSSEPQAAQIQVRHFIASTMFDADAQPRVSFYLRHRDRAEAVAGSTRGGVVGSGSAALGVPVFGASFHSAGPGSGFSIAADLIRFPDQFQAYEPFTGISAEWLTRAELVVVRTISSGSVERTLEIPGLRMRER